MSEDGGGVTEREADLSDSSGHVVVAGAGGRYLDSLERRQRHGLFTTTERPAHYQHAEGRSSDVSIV